MHSRILTFIFTILLISCSEKKDVEHVNKDHLAVSDFAIECIGEVSEKTILIAGNSKTGEILIKEGVYHFWRAAKIEISERTYGFDVLETSPIKNRIGSAIIFRTGPSVYLQRDDAYKADRYDKCTTFDGEQKSKTIESIEKRIGIIERINMEAIDKINRQKPKI